MSEMSGDWAAWMRAANAGDGMAYRRLLTAMVPYLRNMARRLCRGAGADTGDAEDIVQETLLAVHLKRHTWDSTKPIEPWLRAILQHKAIDHFRRRGRRLHVSLDAVMEILPAGESCGNSEDQHDAVRLARRLGGRQGEIVRAISLEGASIRDTALRFGMTEGAVRTALHRGLKSLAALFKDGET